jgi:hypothetical protein
MIYTTASEIRFIERLGQFSEHCKRTSRKQLLQRYIVGCYQRQEWDDINRDAVLEFARQEMERCR